MKWKNKGHEYDEIFANIKNIKKLYLFGAGHDGDMVLNILEKRYNIIPVDGFVDNNANLIGKEKSGKHIFSLEELDVSDDVGIVVSFASEFIESIDGQLSCKGWVKYKNFWHYEEFIAIVAAYEYNQLFMSSICILPTTRCNLRCKSCLNFTNFIKNFENRSIERLKEEVDLFFSCVDYIGLFFISGGEPFLYPNLAELISYINKRYREKIYSFEMVTNGTVRPKAEILESLRENKVILTIDDYREALPDKVESISNNINYIRDFLGEKFTIVRKYDEWIDLYPHPVRQMNNEELICKYDKCHVPWQEYRNGRLFSCNYAAFAENAGIITGDFSSESLLLESTLDKKIIMEFRLGYSEKGYVEFCKKCAGYLEINDYKVKVAEQE